MGFRLAFYEFGAKKITCLGSRGKENLPSSQFIYQRHDMQNNLIESEGA